MRTFSTNSAWSSASSKTRCWPSPRIWPCAWSKWAGTSRLLPTFRGHSATSRAARCRVRVLHYSLSWSIGWPSPSLISETIPRLWASSSILRSIAILMAKISCIRPPRSCMRRSVPCRIMARESLEVSSLGRGRIARMARFMISWPSMCRKKWRLVIRRDGEFLLVKRSSKVIYY